MKFNAKVYENKGYALWYGKIDDKDNQLLLLSNGYVIIRNFNDTQIK